MSEALERFQSMLAAGRDSALLRLGLGLEYSKLGNYERAVAHLEQALAFDAQQSAVYKHLGNALVGEGKLSRALSVYERGIEVAERRGDRQAAKEMGVFLRRARKRIEADRAPDIPADPP